VAAWMPRKSSLHGNEATDARSNAPYVKEKKRRGGIAAAQKKGSGKLSFKRPRGNKMATKKAQQNWYFPATQRQHPIDRQKPRDGGFGM